MASFSAKILNNATSALGAQQAVIASISNNISNVNTAGYSRRTVDLQNRIGTGASGGLNIGNGVEVGQVRQVIDVFLNTAQRTAAADQSRYGVESDLLQRLDQLFSTDGGLATIGGAFSEFLSAAQDLQTDAGSLQLRQNFVDRASDLVNSLTSTYSDVAGLQTEADNRLEAEVSNINSITSQIADLNGLITSAESGGSVAPDERDRRSQLLEQLSSKLSISIVEDQTGSVSVSLANGFSLVTDTTSKNLEFTRTPSFDATPPPSLSGARLGYIVYDYDQGPGSAHVDLTSTIAGKSGSMAGLLAMRGTHASTSDTSAFSASGTLVGVATRIEAFTRELLTTVNTTYLGPDRLGGTAGFQSSAGDLNGNNPAVFGLFTFTGAADSDLDGLPSTTDLTASGLDNFTSRLSLAFSSPNNVAAARDASGGAVTAVYPQGDGSNMQALVASLTQSSTSFSLGSYSFSGSFEQQFNETVTYVGSKVSTGTLNRDVSQDKYLAAKARGDAVSGVSLDEEFTQLIQYQKSFEAAARLLKVGQDLLSEILNIL